MGSVWVYPKNPFMTFPPDPKYWPVTGRSIDGANPTVPTWFYPWGNGPGDPKTAGWQFCGYHRQGTQHRTGGGHCRVWDLSNRESPIYFVLWEDKGVDYIIREPEKYRNKNVLIAGGVTGFGLDHRIGRTGKIRYLVHRHQ